MAKALFEVCTLENTQHITINDSQGMVATEAMIIGQGTKAIAYAVLAYAHRHRIHPTRAQYSVRPTRKGEI